MRAQLYAMEMWAGIISTEYESSKAGMGDGLVGIARRFQSEHGNENTCARKRWAWHPAGNWRAHWKVASHFVNMGGGSIAARSVSERSRNEMPVPIWRIQVLTSQEVFLTYKQYC